MKKEGATQAVKQKLCKYNASINDPLYLHLPMTIKQAVFTSTTLWRWQKWLLCKAFQGPRHCLTSGICMIMSS